MAAIKTDAQSGALATPLGAASAAVLVDSSDGRIVGANRCACSILGWRRVELLALAIADVGVSQPTVGRLDGEALLRHRDGRSIPVRYQIRCINLADESLYLWVVRCGRIGAQLLSTSDVGAPRARSESANGSSRSCS